MRASPFPFCDHAISCVSHFVGAWSTHAAQSPQYTIVVWVVSKVQGLLEPAANLTVINLILPVLCNSLQPDDTNHVAMFAFTHNVWPGHRVACLNKFNMTLQSRVSLVIQDIHLLASIAKQVSLKKTLEVWRFNAIDNISLLPLDSPEAFGKSNQVMLC